MSGRVITAWCPACLKDELWQPRRHHSGETLYQSSCKVSWAANPHASKASSTKGLRSIGNTTHSEGSSK